MNSITKTMLIATILLMAGASLLAMDDVEAVDETADDVVQTGNNVARIGDTYYASLEEAFQAVKDGKVSQPVTIQLVDDCSGKGISVPAGSNITLDFNGYEFTNNGGVGSTGTETNGFQLLKGSNIVFKNGTLSAVVSPACQILIQNYCNLTLDNMVLNGSSSTGYLVSNNCGNTKFTNGTVLNAYDGKTAFDVYYWPSNSYTEGVTVTIEDATINGKIEYGTDGSPAAKDFIGKAMLRINGGSINGVISTNNCFDSDPNISITGGTFSSNVSDYVASGCQQVGSIVGPVDQSASISGSNANVESSSETDTVVIPVDGEGAENATVSVSVNASGDIPEGEGADSKVSMVFQGDIEGNGLAVSAKQVASSALPDTVIKNNLLATFDLSVQGATSDKFNLTVTVSIPTPVGMVLSNAWVIYYDDNGVEQDRFDATINGSEITFRTIHTSAYSVYGEYEEEEGSGSGTGSWDDDEDLPPFIPTQPAENDDTVTIVACAAAAAVAAILAVFLVIDRK